MSLKREELVAYLNRYLQVDDFDDHSQNGIQVEGPEEISRIALAVDACQETFQRAVAAEAGLLIVHHGLFWGQSLLLVGSHLRRVRTLIEGACGLYGVHLPLDAHPEVGNNAQLAYVLDLTDCRRFGTYHGAEIGVAGSLKQPLSIGVVVEMLAAATGRAPLRVLRGGSEQVSHVGCISGGAAMMMSQAAREGLDTFVTGEMDHTFYHTAFELGLNVVFGGHYGTETLGVQALGRHLKDRFDLETVYFDVPTGM